MRKQILRWAPCPYQKDARVSAWLGKSWKNVIFRDAYPTTSHRLQQVGELQDNPYYNCDFHTILVDVHLLDIWFFVQLDTTSASPRIIAMNSCPNEETKTAPIGMLQTL